MQTLAEWTCVQSTCSQYVVRTSAMSHANDTTDQCHTAAAAGDKMSTHLVTATTTMIMSMIVSVLTTMSTKHKVNDREGVFVYITNLNIDSRKMYVCIHAHRPVPNYTAW